jgi:FkbM family methyltransferase
MDLNMANMVTISALLIGLAVLFILLRVYRAVSSKMIMQQLSESKPLSEGRSSVIEVSPPYQLVQSRHGWMLVNPNDIYLGQAVLEYGECCEIEVQFLMQLLSIRPGAVVEIGTNIGTHTIPIAKALALQRRDLVVFEPQPFIFQNMCANLALNGLTNTRAWPYACADRHGTLYFQRPDYTSQGNFGGISMESVEASESCSVPCVRLDDVMGSEAVALMKVDVEGFELIVLQGAENILTRSRPVIYVENDRIEKSKELIEWLWSRNYQLWWHLPPLFNPENFFGKEGNIFKGVVSINMLCLPRELNFPVAGLEEILDTTHPSEKWRSRFD